MKNIDLITLLHILLTASLLPGCTRGGEEKKASAVAAAPVRKEAAVTPVVSHYLVKEAARTELWYSGLFMDLGTADQHKYTRGQHHGRWGDVAQGSPTYLPAKVGARLFFSLLDEPFAEVWMRARSAVAGQTVAVKVDAFRTEPAALTAQWKIHRLKMPRAPSTGHKSMQLFFGKPGAGDLADIDWVWLRAGSEEREAPTDRVAVRSFDRPMRGLVADGERAYSYYLNAPAGASLEFSIGSSCACPFTVEAEVHGAPRQTLYKGTARAGKWVAGKADLAGIAALPGRLILRADCPGCTASWGDPVIRRPPPIPPPEANKRPVARNLVIVVLDAARQDLYRPFNPASPVKAPALEELARGGAIFPAAQTNSNWTLPSVATLLTGTYLSRHLWNEAKLRAIPRTVPLISQHLRSRGFATAAFMGLPILNAACGFKRGWDQFVSRYDKAGDKDPTQVFKHALGWIKGLKGRRFFTYIHAFGPHLPLDTHKGYTEAYLGKEPYKGPIGARVSEKLSRGKGAVSSFSAADRARVLAMYRGEAAYNDHHLGTFIQGLRALGILDRTLVLFANDHGEEVFDRGGYGHGHGLHAELIASPLIMRFPPIFKGGLVSPEPIALVDLVPTSLDVLGLSLMPGLHGVSVLPALRGRPAMEPPYLLADAGPERAVRLGNYKLMLTPKGARLHNLAADPGEKKNLFNTHRTTARALEVMLAEGTAIPQKRLRLQGMAAPWKPKPTPAKLNEEVRKRLEALGYVGD